MGKAWGGDARLCTPLSGMQPEGAILSPPERSAAQRDVSLLVGAEPPPPPWPLMVMFHGQSEPQQ